MRGDHFASPHRALAMKQRSGARASELRCGVGSHCPGSSIANRIIQWGRRARSTAPDPRSVGQSLGAGAIIRGGGDVGPAFGIKVVAEDGDPAGRFRPCHHVGRRAVQPIPELVVDVRPVIPSRRSAFRCAIFSFVARGRSIARNQSAPALALAMG